MPGIGQRGLTMQLTQWIALPMNLKIESLITKDLQKVGFRGSMREMFGEFSPRLGRAREPRTVSRYSLDARAQLCWLGGGAASCQPVLPGVIAGS